MRYWEEERHERKRRKKEKRRRKKEKKRRERRETTKITLPRDSRSFASTITKVHRTYNGWSQLSRSQSFHLEIHCLKRLEQHFECICGRGHHFPRVIRYNAEQSRLTLSYRGPSIDKLRSSTRVSKMEAQVKCIIHNLRKSEIKHLDMHDTNRTNFAGIWRDTSPIGKNLCVNRHGIISVIDFDVACAKSDFRSSAIRGIARSYGTDRDYYHRLRRRIISILKRSPYIDLI